MRQRHPLDHHRHHRAPLVGAGSWPDQRPADRVRRRGAVHRDAGDDGQRPRSGRDHLGRARPRSSACQGSPTRSPPRHLRDLGADLDLRHRGRDRSLDPAQPHHLRPAHPGHRRQPGGLAPGRHQRHAVTPVLLYALVGLCCGIAAVMLISRTTTGSATHGQLYELDAIAAVVIGGTLLAGGRGTIVGTVFGVLIFATLSNVFVINNLSISAQAFTSRGLIIIAAVLLQKRLPSRPQGHDHPTRPSSQPSTASDQSLLHPSARSRSTSMKKLQVHSKNPIVPSPVSLCSALSACISNTPPRSPRTSVPAPPTPRPAPTTRRATRSSSASPPLRPTTAGWARSPQSAQDRRRAVRRRRAARRRRHQRRQPPDLPGRDVHQRRAWTPSCCCPSTARR